MENEILMVENLEIPVSMTPRLMPALKDFAPLLKKSAGHKLMQQCLVAKIRSLHCRAITAVPPETECTFEVQKKFPVWYGW